MSLLASLRGQLKAAPKHYSRDLGWKTRRTTEGQVYTGHYRAVGLRMPGWILNDTAGKLQFFIHQPPMDLLRETDFGGCFHPRNDGWWLVAFKPHAQPKDIDSGIASIQKALLTAFEVRAAKRRGQPQ